YGQEAAGSEDPPAATGPDAAPGPTDVFDPEQFREFVTTDKFTRELLAIFHEDCDQMLEEVAAAAEAGDPDVLHTAAHSFKGFLGNYCGARALAAATELDDFARDDQLDAARACLPALRQETARLRIALESFEQSLPPATGTG
ncbi:MAG: hypothetical protein HKO57_11505, partial [Akkermansiaceae bacterium]|nr:hypothetical protein [Akkermansiaceae bacterium]